MPLDKICESYHAKKYSGWFGQISDPATMKQVMVKVTEYWSWLRPSRDAYGTNVVGQYQIFEAMTAWNCASFSRHFLSKVEEIVLYSFLRPLVCEICTGGHFSTCCSICKAKSVLLLYAGCYEIFRARIEGLTSRPVKLLCIYLPITWGLVALGRNYVIA